MSCTASCHRLRLCSAASCLAFELRGLSATERRDRAPSPTTKGLLLTLAVGAGYQALNILGGLAMRVLDDFTEENVRRCFRRGSCLVCPAADGRAGGGGGV